MILAEHDQHRCELRVRSPRHGHPLPIPRSELLHHPASGLLRAPFATSAGEKSLLGALKRRAATADGSIAARPQT